MQHRSQLRRRDLQRQGAMRKVVFQTLRRQPKMDLCVLWQQCRRYHTSSATGVLIPGQWQRQVQDNNKGQEGWEGHHLCLHQYFLMMVCHLVQVPHRACLQRCRTKAVVAVVAWPAPLHPLLLLLLPPPPYLRLVLLVLAVQLVEDKGHLVLVLLVVFSGSA
jgi:hypothetical protein